MPTIPFIDCGSDPICEAAFNWKHNLQTELIDKIQKFFASFELNANSSADCIWYVKLTMAKLKVLLSLILGILSGTQTAYAEFFEVKILKPQSNEDVRYLYAEQLLEMALAKVNFDGTVKRAVQRLSRNRLLQELKRGEYIHVSAEVPKAGWEEQLLTIRIPIRKGIQGYRLFLINKGDQEALTKVNSLEDLQKFPTGLGSQWSITPIFQRAGFDVFTSDDYTALFKMLKLKRFVTFSRGLNEVYNEQRTFSEDNKNLVIEETLGLFVPLPTYFFVSPKHPELAEKIELGLRRMMDDGSFDKHFIEYHHEDIDRANLTSRKIFQIENIDLSEETPLGIKSYWFDPKKYAAEKADNDS